MSDSTPLDGGPLLREIRSGPDGSEIDETHRPMSSRRQASLIHDAGTGPLPPGRQFRLMAQALAIVIKGPARRFRMRAYSFPLSVRREESQRIGPSAIRNTYSFESESAGITASVTFFFAFHS